MKLLFPNPTSTLVEQVMGKSYNCTLRGHTVVAIDPPGAHCPLYERSAMRSDTAPLVTVNRFVSDETNLLQRIPAAPGAFAKRGTKSFGN